MAGLHTQGWSSVNVPSLRAWPPENNRNNACGGHSSCPLAGSLTESPSPCAASEEDCIHGHQPGGGRRDLGVRLPDSLAPSCLHKTWIKSVAPPLSPCVILGNYLSGF